MGYQSEQHRWNAILSHLGLKTIKLKKPTQPEQPQLGELAKEDLRKKRSRVCGVRSASPAVAGPLARNNIKDKRHQQ